MRDNCMSLLGNSNYVTNIIMHNIYLLAGVNVSLPTTIIEGQSPDMELQIIGINFAELTIQVCLLELKLVFIESSIKVK